MHSLCDQLTTAVSTLESLDWRVDYVLSSSYLPVRALRGVITLPINLHAGRMSSRPACSSSLR